MSITVLSDIFTGNGDLTSPWVNVNGIFTQRAITNWQGNFVAPTYTYTVGAAILARTNPFPVIGATGNGFLVNMGKAVLTTPWYPLLSGDASNDKVAEISCDLVWRQIADGTVPGYYGLVFAGTSNSIGGYAVLVSRAIGGASTTGRLVKIDLTSSYASPTFTDIGGAAVTLPNATNGERWKLKAKVTWFAPTFTIASILATFVDATGTSHVIGLPTGQNVGTYALATGQTNVTSWANAQLHVGFIERDPYTGWATTPTYTGGRIAAQNQFERLRVTDSSALANLTTATPAYTYSTPISYSTASVSTETNASAYSLAVQPSFSQETVDDWAVSEFYSDSGDRVAFPFQTKRRRRWSFRWSALDDSEKASLATLNSNVKGRFSTWSWTDPETAVAVNVRFTSDIEFQKIGPTAWSAAANVEEVL